MQSNEDNLQSPAPHVSERVGTVPHSSERKPGHVLSVREVARMFEAAGVSRTERSIVKWCQPNKHDLARLDAFFDPNERRWFITQESVESAIGEEKAKAARRNEPIPNDSEHVGAIPKRLEAATQGVGKDRSGTSEEIKVLEREVLDLKILTAVKVF
jgi:hypothetical protein